MKVIDLQKVSRGTDFLISDNFSLSEFLVTSTGKVNDDINTCVLGNLCLLCRLVLEPVRAKINEPIYITSGYRSKEVNYSVGGVSRSYHRFGLAADLACSSESYAKRLMAALVSQGNYLSNFYGLDLRFEYYDVRHFIHVQLSANDILDINV